MKPKSSRVSQLSQIPSLIPGLFLLLMVAACSVSVGWWGWGSHTSTTVYGNGSFIYTTDTESVRAEVKGNEVQIVVFREGKLYGIDGLSAAQRKNLRSVKSGGRKFVDHPKLATWQRQLTTVNELAQKPNTTARELADAATGLPFDGLIDSAVTQWVRNDPERAATMLDLVAELKPGRETTRKLLETALRSNSDTIDDDRVTNWLSAKVIYKDAKAIQIIGSYKALGPKSAEQIMQNIDEVYGSDRKDIYITAGRRLVNDVGHARVLAKKLDELYGSNRMEAALALLQQKDATTEYAIELLENIDDFYGSNRLRVYLAAGEKAIVDARAPRLLTSQLDELYGSDRHKAALAVLDWEGSNNTVALGMLRQIDDFYGSNRASVIHHIIDGRHFKDPRVQRACLRAISDELYGTRKRKALTRMLKSEELDEKVRKLVLAELED